MILSCTLVFEGMCELLVRCGRQRLRGSASYLLFGLTEQQQRQGGKCEGVELCLSSLSCEAPGTELYIGA